MPMEVSSRLPGEADQSTRRSACISAQCALDVLGLLRLGEKEQGNQRNAGETNQRASNSSRTPILRESAREDAFWTISLTPLRESGVQRKPMCGPETQKSRKRTAENELSRGTLDSNLLH